jgi:hypothetical protein
MYQDEHELWEDLETFDLTDLDVVHNDEGYAVWRETPGFIHHGAVDRIQIEFDRWKREHATVVFRKTRPNVFMVERYERNMKRCPDFAIWGPTD